MSKYLGRIITNQAPAGYSVAFDGNGDYLTVSGTTAFNFGTADFTFECWVYQPDINAGTRIIASLTPYVAGNTGWAMYFGAGYVAWFVNNANRIVSTNPVVAGTWNHLAIVRSSGSTKMYINGVVTGSTYTDSTNYSGTAQYVGADPSQNYFGYISNVRAVKGTALYTANFTPPTQLLNVTNTSLLTCNSPAIVDQSSNAFAITTNGNAAVSTFTPFAAYNPYNPSLGASTPGVWTLDEAMQAAATRQWNMYDPSFQNTTLLLHGNGTNGAQNNTFLDSSSNNFTITRNGNTTQGTFSPFSQSPGWWGNYFNGSSDNLTFNASSAGAFGTGDFTVELWVCKTASGDTTVIDARTSNAAIPWVVDLNSDIPSWYTGASNQGTTAISQNAWNHIAFCRSGTTHRIFINGIQTHSFTDSTNYSSQGSSAPIGRNLGAGSPRYFPGYISNLRIVKGTALYTSAFTPSATPLTAVTNTSLLTCQSNRFVDNSSNALTITVAAGTPSVQAFSPFYPTAAYTPATIGGSGYFDGTGDFLQTPSINIGTNTFSFDCWLYPTVAQGTAATIFTGNNTSSLQLSFFGNSLGIAQRGVAWQVTGTATVPISAWSHVAFVRSGTGTNQTSIYLNGNRIANGTVSFSYVDSPYQFSGTNAGAAEYQGYMSGVRFFNGSTPYDATQSTITIPTAPPIPTSTTLCLNFTNAGIVDSTAKNVLETVGNAQISTTQSKFGGSSMYFDGTGDYLLLPSSPNFAFSGDFTVEAWVYLTANIANGVGGYLTDFRVSSTNNYAFGFLGDAGVTKMYSFIGAVPASTTGTATVTLNTWNHVAYVRSGGVITMYLNGAANGTLSNSFSQSATSVTICSRFNGATEYITGYIDDLRITRFARYTAAFTPQTSQWQDQ